MRKSPSFLGSALSGCLFFTVTLASLASPPKTIRTLPSGSPNLVDLGYGSAVALSPKYLVVGAPGDDEKGANAGAVYLHNAVTGAFLRRLTPPANSASEAFGTAVAISGSKLYIGAPGASLGRGIVYVFNADTGKQSGTLTSNSIFSNAGLGSSLAVEGDTVIAGAPLFNGERGTAIVFNAKSASEDFALVASDAAVGDRFGKAVALTSGIAVVTSPRDNGSAGSAYAYDTRTGGELAKMIPSDSVAGMDFGDSIATSGELVLVGAPADTNGQDGAVYVLELVTFQQLFKVSSPHPTPGFGRGVAASLSLGLVGDGNSADAYLVDLSHGKLLATVESGNNASFGNTVALCGNAAAVGEELDNTLASNAGAAYLLSPVVGTEPFDVEQSLVKNGLAGDRGTGIYLKSFKQVAINRNGAIGAVLSAAGSGLKSGTIITRSAGSIGVPGVEIPNLPGTFYAQPSSLIMSQTAHSLFLTTMTGVGINAGNNSALMKSIGYDLGEALLTSDMSIDAGNSPKIKAFIDVKQSIEAVGSIGAAITLKPGIGGTTASSDSGVILLGNTGVINKRIIEGGSQPFSAELLGQFPGRLAMPGEAAVFSAALQSSASSNQALFYQVVSNNLVGIQRRGLPTPIGGLNWSSFSGETITTDSYLLYRAVVTGSNVTAANNEALWMGHPAFATSAILRKGDDCTMVTPFAKYKKILRYWPAGSHQALILAQLTGNGITTANDTILLLHQSDGSQTLLLRKGDAIASCDGAKVGNFEVVDATVNNGFYVVLTSLTGCTADTNQALFLGCATRGNAGSDNALRRPFLKLRKGMWVNDDAGGASKISSLALPAVVTDSAGAGGKGGANIVNDFGQLPLIVTYSNGYQHQVLTAWPMN